MGLEFFVPRMFTPLKYLHVYQGPCTKLMCAQQSLPNSFNVPILIIAIHTDYI